MGLVLPTDNAVIDYSIINQMISAINNHEQVINQIKGQNPASTATGASGATSSSSGSVAITVTVGGVLKAPSTTAKTFSLSRSSLSLSTIVSFTATPYLSGTTPAYCWISSVNSSTIVFSTNVAVPAIYYNVTGTR